MDERFDPKNPINPVEAVLHASRYQYALRQMNKTDTDKKVLDIACGVGYGSSILKTRKSTITGIDIAKKTIDEAKKRSGTRVTFMLGSITDIPLPSSSVDTLVSFETIEHVSASQGKKAFSEFKRVLKPRGTLIISSPNRYFTNVLEKFIPTYHNEHHKYEYEVQEIRRLFLQYGFIIRSEAGQYPFFPPFYLFGQKSSLAHWFFKPSTLIPPSICRYFIITAEKG